MPTALASPAGIFGTLGSGFYGREFYVCNRSGVSSGDGKTPKRPFSTLARAFQACANSGIQGATAGMANDGTIIHVGEGHAENITVADAWSALTSTGVKIAGYGDGSRRPTLTWTAAAAQIILARAGTWLHNFNLNLYDSANDATITLPFDVTAAGVRITSCLIDCGSVAARGCATGIRLSAGANDFVFGGRRNEDFGNRVFGSVASGVLLTTFINVNAAVARALIGANTIRLATSANGVGVVQLNAAGEVDVVANQLANTKAGSTAALTGFAACTGFVDENHCEIQAATGGATAINTIGNWFMGQNLGVAIGGAGHTGVSIGTASS